eukprot:gene8916-biopygen6069
MSYTILQWIQLGCGDTPYNCPEKEATFGCDHLCPAVIPDLSNHSNLMAEVLRANPEVYLKYKDMKTVNGVTFADCIKTGVDNKNNPSMTTAGATNHPSITALSGRKEAGSGASVAG